MSIAPRIVSGRAYFHIERPKLALEFSYEFEEEERDNPNFHTEDTSHEFREALELETEGWIYHPGLLIYTVGVRPEWEQRIEDRSEEGRESRSDFLEGYDVYATFLQYKPYTLNLFARRYETAVGSAFAKESETETDTYGASLLFKYPVLPTTLSYTHSDSSQTGFFVYDEDVDDFSLSMRHYVKSSDTRLNATYTDRERTTNVLTTTRVENSNNYITNYFDITGDRRKVLNSFLFYNWTDDDTGTTSTFRVSERFHWKHREDLRSDYEATYNNDRFEDFHSERLFGAAGLTHLLYENLTTTLRGDANLQDFNGGSENVYGGRLNFDYRRRIPWGMLNINIGQDYEIATREGTEKLIQVIDESHVLTTGVVTLLDNENVDISSITVTDITGTIVYVENVDYTIAVIDSFVRISRTTFGAIANGQTVLVDYLYLSEPPFDDTTWGQSYGVNFDLWSALGLYYRFDRWKQQILSGPRPDNPIDDTTHTGEVRLDWRWSSTRLSYEDADLRSGVSTERWFAEENLTFRPAKGLFSLISGRFGETRFTDTDEKEEFYGLEARVDWVPTRWSKLRLEGFWENISGDIEETVNTGVSSTLELYYRIWSGKLTYTFLDEDDQLNDDRRTNHYLLFQIRRELD